MMTKIKINNNKILRNDICLEATHIDINKGTIYFPN